MEIHLIDLVLFISFFLIITGLLSRFTSKISALPYTVALLLLGAIFQLIVHYFHIPVHLELSADMIYFVLLPLLLFEAAFHINFHQFKIQFKTITFIATFGLLLSIFTIGFILARFTGLPLDVSILFGALISATDPIAVITLFKSLGAPKRLGLVADGESMLNDATGVIAFRVVSAFVVTSTQFQSSTLINSLGNFLYVFIGSLIFGAIVGYLFSKLIEKIENDRVIETTITVAAALGSFAAAEHFFHLSGVITTVITGLVVGNLGKTKFSHGVREFVEEFWAYFAFLSVSAVFFFATFNLDFSIFTKNPWHIVIAIIAVLVGRAVSVYVSFLFTNTLPMFKDEPNVPMKWQHILNWGGLRGVIPLVLVYSLPETFEYRDEMLSFTMGAFLFTLLVNGLTIRNLLLALGLHLPKREEEIIKEEMAIFELENAKDSLKKLQAEEFDPELLNAVTHEIDEEEAKHKKYLQEISTPEEFSKSLRLHAINLERETLEKLYEQQFITENVYFDFDTELDLQQDALEYPEVYEGRAIHEGGFIDSARSFRKRISGLRTLASHLPFVKNWAKDSRDSIIKDRVALLKARIITSETVVEYFKKLDTFMCDSKECNTMIMVLIKEQEALIDKNKKELQKLTNEHPKLLKDYQRKLAYSLVHATPQGKNGH